MTDSKSPEQVALDHLLDNAYEEFSQSLHSIGARSVLWASFKDAAELQQHYFSAKDKKYLLDGRRSKSLSQQEIDLKATVESCAHEAEEFIFWVRSRAGQPIYREILIAYCSAFEVCLKNVALVFRLAKTKKRGLNDQVFVPGDEFRRTLRMIQENWRNSGDAEFSRAELFFEDEILRNDYAIAHFNFLPMADPKWQDCRAAFQARNALVHQLGRPTTSIEIAGEVLHAGWEIELSIKQLETVKTAFRMIFWPISPMAQL